MRPGCAARGAAVPLFHHGAPRLEAAGYPSAKGTYQAINLLKDLSRGLFIELKQPAPVIDLYRRDRQSKYVNMLVSSLGSCDPELDVAIRAGINDLYPMLDNAAKRAKDRRTQWHLKSLKGALERG